MPTVGEIRKYCAGVDPETQVWHLGYATEVTVGQFLERLAALGDDEVIAILGAGDDRPPRLEGDRMVWG